MKMEEKGISTALIVVIVVTVVVVAVAVSAVILLKPGEAPAPGGPTTTPTATTTNTTTTTLGGTTTTTTPGTTTTTTPTTTPTTTYELFYDYQVGECYTYETTATTTIDNMVTEEFSTYTMQVTAVEGNEITAKNIETIENIDPHQYGVTIESAEVTMTGTMTNKGEMISWEIESVVPPELWENVELYENSQMMYSQLFQTIYVFPEEPVSICQEWEKSIEGEIPWGPGMYMTLTGQGSAHFVGQESVTVDAGTFECWRIDYDLSVSGGLTYDNQMFTINITLEGPTWYSKLNCAQIKSTMSMIMSVEYDGTTYEYSTNSVTELVGYGTT